jgi:hypothetical protein
MPVSHIRNTTSSLNSDIIGPGAEDMMNRAFREAKTYVELTIIMLINKAIPQRMA